MVPRLCDNLQWEPAGVTGAGKIINWEPIARICILGHAEKWTSGQTVMGVVHWDT